ncbi:hypothetical protein RAZWK3B_03960 [Roseobacter sp. AzwK-3b]|jgi:hypothetical protein|uniref:Argininosuccinate lyase n=1 Tax=Roseovarius litoreus TaxID=1155722 RepID=A0A1M7AW00_9RHOB|nr:MULTISPECIES: hypothetical protein [Roseobacteraceae]EDM73346.1 hypothetical protein RAZWK3B_03960 [Roseobacter sp. AzwK-3b]SHL46913.1 hypothetical protein SAMN05443432_101596 [Roseovarius litoreus]
MTRIGAVLALTAMAALAGCGADGEPIRPTAKANVGVGERGVNGAVGTKWISGTVSVDVGATF